MASASRFSLACFAAAWCIVACFPIEAIAGTSATSLASAPLLAHALDQARGKTGTPGVSAAIIVDGRVVWLGQSGLADVKTGRSVDEGTMFSLASVTKMFVAAVVLRLAEERHLSLEDPIDRYVPSYVLDARRVTVWDLLGHTSGYRDDEDDPVILRELDDPNFKWTRDDLMRREGHVRFKPRSKFDYCNSCYVMLGSVIARAGGASIGDQLARYITTPLEIGSEADFDRLPSFAPRISVGYDLQHGKLVDTFVGAKDLGVPTSIWGPVWTDGGIVATAVGVARFTDALFGGRVVSARSLVQMLDPGPAHPHDEVLEKWRYDGHAWRGHSGFYYGFTAESWYDASRKLTITVLANRTDNGDPDPATAIWNRLSTAYDGLP